MQQGKEEVIQMLISREMFSTVDFPGGSDGKASAYNVGDPGSIRGSGRSPGHITTGGLRHTLTPRQVILTSCRAQDRKPVCGAHTWMDLILQGQTTVSHGLRGEIRKLGTFTGQEGSSWPRLPSPDTRWQV